MEHSVNRRHFLASATGGIAALAGASALSAAENKVVIGVMGTGGRGNALSKGLAGQPGIEIAYLCDVDENNLNKTTAEVTKIAGKAPQAVGDFRKILDDKSVTALLVTTGNHWHAPAAILGCAAGKHVYVEKPCSHNPHEGELLVAAARKHKRHVQMGNQRRSWDKIIEAMKRLQDGVIGRVYLAQSWYMNNRPSIGIGKETPIPKGLDYAMWQGPAPVKPFHNNYLHYHWHWFWHWGNGELGNNGIHMIDLCRWGLNVDFPIRVSSSGGRYRFQDDQETPDTHQVCFEFEGRKSITWEGLSCNQNPEVKADVMFHGEKGSLSIRGTGYTICDLKGKEIEAVKGTGSEKTHLANFLATIRGEASLTSEIEQGHRSTLLCHLGNIAHRTGRALKCDGTNGHILQDKEAMALWTREYNKAWEPKV